LLSKSDKLEFNGDAEDDAEGIVIVQDGILKYVNNASEGLIGYDPKEITGKVFYEFISPEYRKLVMERYYDRMEGIDVAKAYDIELLDKNGSAIPVQIKSELISFGERAAIMVFIKRISESRLAEQKMKQLHSYIEGLIDTKTKELNDVLEKLVLVVNEIKTENQQLQNQLEMETLVSNLILRSLSPLDLKDSIVSSLRDVGRLSGAESASLFLIDDDNGLLIRTHDWFDRQSDIYESELKNFPLEEFNNILLELRKEEAIYLPDVSNLSAESKEEIRLLELANLKSILMLPMFTDDILRGFVIFNNVDSSIQWDEANLTMHRILIDLIGNIFGRIRITQ
jgi:PAS domain S-box-containing protein